MKKNDFEEMKIHKENVKNLTEIGGLFIDTLKQPNLKKKEDKEAFLRELYFGLIRKHGTTPVAVALLDEVSKILSVTPDRAKELFQDFNPKDPQKLFLQYKRQENIKQLENLVITKISYKKSQKIITPKLNTKKINWINEFLAEDSFHVLAGQKASGKTFLLLNTMLNFLKSGRRCAFWLSSETTREVRIDPFLRKHGFDEVPENLLVTDDKFEIINKIDTLDFIAIDDLFEFLHLQGILDTSRKLGHFNRLADLFNLIIIGVVHQTKTSRKETNFEMRGAGNAKIVTVPRVFLNLEKVGKKDSKYKGKSILSIGATNYLRPESFKNNYVLNDDFTIGQGLEGDGQDIFDEHILNKQEQYRSEVSSEKIQKVKEIIESKGGQIYSKTLYKEAEQLGISGSLVRKARLTLGCTYSKIGREHVTHLPEAEENTENEDDMPF